MNNHEPPYSGEYYPKNLLGTPNREAFFCFISTLRFGYPLLSPARGNRVQNVHSPLTCFHVKRQRSGDVLVSLLPDPRC
jgi:hypothetical protein